MLVPLLFSCYKILYLNFCFLEKLCPIEILTFTNGDVSCTDKNLYGSECLFKCNPGYELVDPGDDYDVTSMVVKCGEKAIWDAVKQPTCRRITCTPDMQKLNEVKTYSRTR